MPKYDYKCLECGEEVELDMTIKTYTYSQPPRCSCDKPMIRDYINIQADVRGTARKGCYNSSDVGK